MDVGWWVSFDNCDLHHSLHCAGSCEVLIGRQWSVGQWSVVGTRDWLLSTDADY